ncbi:MAG: hypothetical protein K9L68_09380 [Spirochaetales bacterium]|nr:hypothetical protein [Spirochaetales bacterium]MCF7938797.1 hypothetical protein [Spirochaetales bacterium]
MRRSIKKTFIGTTALIAALLFVTAGVFAQDSFLDEEPGSGEGGFSEVGESQAQPALEWSGFLETTLRSYMDYENPFRNDNSAYPRVGLDLHYEGDNSEVKAGLRFHRNWDFDLTSTDMNISWYLQRMIDEAYLRLYYDHFDIQAGYIKEVWGTGDQVHVVDVLNPIDYYDFVNNDYIERKVAEFMFKANIRLGMNGMAELVYLPVFTPDLLPTGGRWAPAQTQQLTDLTTAVQSTTGDISYPGDMDTLANGQYALRLSGTLGPVDLGGMYYFGYLHQPSFDVTYVGATPTALDISYDRLHLFGLEAAAAPAGFNLRAEAAYYLTEDFEGDDEMRENNHSIKYVAGFDRDLPISNLNINIQGNGSYYINEEDDPTDNIVSAALTDSWVNDRIKPEFSFAMGIENQDFRLSPELTFVLVDDAELSLRYMLYHGDSDTLFGGYDDNDFAEISFRYDF